MFSNSASMVISPVPVSQTCYRVLNASILWTYFQNRPPPLSTESTRHPIEAKQQRKQGISGIRTRDLSLKVRMLYHWAKSSSLFYFAPLTTPTAPLPTHSQGVGVSTSPQRWGKVVGTPSPLNPYKGKWVAMQRKLYSEITLTQHPP